MQFEKDIRSAHRPLFKQARELLLSFDEVTETRKPRITTYSDDHGGICHLRTMPHGIDLGFLKGARMSDPNGRLSGAGKTIRVLSLKEFESETVSYFIEQAIFLNVN